MIQSINSKYLKKNNTYDYKQINPIFANYSNNKEKCLPRSNTKKFKKVIFNPNVSVTEVESWKKYNQDMSKETEFMQFKREYLALKAQKKLNKFHEHNECICSIF